LAAAAVIEAYHGFVLKKLWNGLLRPSPEGRVERDARSEGRRVVDEQKDLRASANVRHTSWVDKPSGRDPCKD
jgi:hypothetical protein